MLKKIIYTGLLVGIISLIPSLVCSQEYKIGVLSDRGGDQALREWKASAIYLSARLGKNFSIVPLGDKQMILWAKEGRLDFVYTNPAMYAELNKKYDVRAIATVVSLTSQVPTDTFGSVIIVRKDSPINQLADLRGRDFMCRGQSDFGGWLLAKQLFLKNGIDPEKEFKSVRETTSHPNVVYAVRHGVVHGGAVRTGTLEMLAKAGKIKLEDFRVINRVEDDFPLVHSTELYGEYPVAACSHVPKELKNEVARALLTMLPTDQAAVAAKIAGFKEPMNYPIEYLTSLQSGRQ